MSENYVLDMCTYVGMAMKGHHTKLIAAWKLKKCITEEVIQMEDESSGKEMPARIKQLLMQEPCSSKHSYYNEVISGMHEEIFDMMEEQEFLKYSIDQRVSRYRWNTDWRKVLTLDSCANSADGRWSNVRKYCAKDYVIKNEDFHPTKEAVKLLSEKLTVVRDIKENIKILK